MMIAGKELGPLEGMKWPMSGTFKEVVPQHMLVFTGGTLDNVDRANDAYIEHAVTMEFEGLGGKTRINLHPVVTKFEGPKSSSVLQGMTAGWNQQLDKMAAELFRQQSVRV